MDTTLIDLAVGTMNRLISICFELLNSEITNIPLCIKNYKKCQVKSDIFKLIFSC